jgi:hypothetical protein
MKALGEMDTSHLANIIDYLAVTACSIGLLITFGECSLKYQRVFPSETGTEYIINKQLLFVPDWLKDTKDRIQISEEKMNAFILLKFTQRNC